MLVSRNWPPGLRLPRSRRNEVIDSSHDHCCRVGCFWRRTIVCASRNRFGYRTRIVAAAGPAPRSIFDWCRCDKLVRTKITNRRYLWPLNSRGQPGPIRHFRSRHRASVCQPSRNSTSRPCSHRGCAIRLLFRSSSIPRRLFIVTKNLSHRGNSWAPNPSQPTCTGRCRGKALPRCGSHLMCHSLV
jgi:hypothetical protein